MEQQNESRESLVAVNGRSNDDHIFWGEFYDNYSPLMYGICLKMAGNENTATEIFRLAFIDIQQALLPTDASTITTLSIIKCTFKTAFDYLKIEDIKTAAKQLFKNNLTLH